MSESTPTTRPLDTADLASEPDVQEAETIVAAFLKALKGYRLYLPNNSTLRSFVQAFFRRLDSFLAGYGELCLRVGQFEISYRGVPVYENRTKESSLAFRMYIHGVREITFHTGVPIEEVTDFLQVIHRSFDSKTTVDDLLTLLWEKDLKYITFIILDDFFDEGEQAEFEEFVEEGRRADHTASAQKASLKPLLERLRSRSDGRGFEDLPDLFHLTDEEHARIAGWIEQERDRDLTMDLCATVLELLDPFAPIDESRTILTMLDQVLESLLQEAQVTRAARVIAELRRFHDMQKEGPVRQVLGEALSRLCGVRAIEMVKPHLTSASAQDRDLLIEFLRALDQSALPALVDLLEKPEFRGFVLPALETMAERYLGFFLGRLKDPRPAILATLVALVGKVGDPRALTSLEGPLFHPDLSVRKEAVKAIERIGTATGLRLLARLISDPEQEMRVRAVRAIAALPAEMARGPLLSVATGKDFAKRSQFEKREVILALGRVHDKEVEDHLIRVLRHRPFFRREGIDELRTCAVRALTTLRTPGAIAALKSRRKDRSKQVRSAVEFALRSLESPEPEEPEEPDVPEREEQSKSRFED